MGEREIIWTHYADAQLSEAFLNLLEESESLETTVRVIDEIYRSTEILTTNPEIYELDELRKNNDGSFRAYEKHTYRVSYQITENKIYIIQVRFARKKPVKY